MAVGGWSLRHHVLMTQDRELGGRQQDTRDDHGFDQASLAGGLRVEQPLQADLAQRAEHGGDMPVRIPA